MVLVSVTESNIFCNFALGNINSKSVITLQMARTAKEPIRIRLKKLANGCQSIYLDIYLNGKRKYEFLKLYIHPQTDKETILANKEAMRMAEAIKAVAFMALPWLRL